MTFQRFVQVVGLSAIVIGVVLLALTLLTAPPGGATHALLFSAVSLSFAGLSLVISSRSGG